MKEIFKRLIYYLIFIVASFLFIYVGSSLIANSITHKFENQISTVILDSQTLKRYCADRKTYDSLKELRQVKVEIIAGDQGSRNIIYFPTQINGHDYQVVFQSQSCTWNIYYSSVKLKEIKKE